MNGINIPEEILTEQKKLEQIQNQRFIEEQNFARVRKLHESERAELIRLEGFKATLEERTAKGSTELDTLKSEVFALAQEKENLLQDIETSRQMFVKINADIDETNAIHDKEKEKISQAHSDLDSRSEEVKAKEEALLARENGVTEREGHIKDLASKL